MTLRDIILAGANVWIEPDVRTDGDGYGSGDGHGHGHGSGSSETKTIIRWRMP